MSDKRNAVIDIAKGIGIILVILGHLAIPGDLLCTFIYTFHMPLFFFLSGCVMSSKYLKGGISKRIYPMLLVYTEICLISTVICSLIPSITVTRYMFIYTVILMVQPEIIYAGHLWYLIATAWCFALFFVINNMFYKRRLYAGFAAFLIYSITAAVSTKFIDVIIGDYQVADIFKIRTSFIGFLFFELGYIIKECDILSKFQKSSPIPVVLLLLSGICCTELANLINGKVNIAMPLLKDPVVYLFGSISGIIMIYAASVLLEKNGIIKKILTWYGRHTLPIFITHIWFINIIQWVMGKYAIGLTDTKGHFAVPLAFTFAIMICIVEIPATKLFDLTLGKLNAYILSPKEIKEE